MMQEFLGHKRKSTTEDYLKTLDRGAVDLADIIDAEDEKQQQTNRLHEDRIGY